MLCSIIYFLQTTAKFKQFSNLQKLIFYIRTVQITGFYPQTIKYIKILEYFFKILSTINRFRLHLLTRVSTDDAWFWNVLMILHIKQTLHKDSVLKRADEGGNSRVL